MNPNPTSIRAVAVYCASSVGKQKAYQEAAISLGKALTSQGRPLIYGGGQNGLMGIISGEVLAGGGHVTGVVPYAFIAIGGEPDKTNMEPSPPAKPALVLREHKNVNTILVDSMHERKQEMAKQSCGFVALPGGYGTWEEIMEVVTWNQLAIHSKPVIVLNVLSFYTPLRQMIRNGIQEGFIPPQNENLMVFVDCPSSDPEDQERFDWGDAALKALEEWKYPTKKHFNLDWTLKTPAVDGSERRQSISDAA